MLYSCVHNFKGWNSTWDRYVTDEFILKDTEENRILQKKLAEEAQLTPLVVIFYCYLVVILMLSSYCSRGGNLYRRDRKRRVKTESKLLDIEPANNSIDDTYMVEKDNIYFPASSDSILLPKRKLPELDFPDNLKYHTGYNCYLAHEKNTVRNNNIKFQLFFLLIFYLI